MRKNTSKNSPESALEGDHLRVMRSKLAGTWYNADSNRLLEEIENYLELVDQPAPENLIGLILPHAGYPYSGSTAAFGIDQIKGKTYKRVIVIGPSHRYPLRNAVSLPDFTHYETPLGKIPLDRDFIDRLQAHSFAKSEPRVHADEHSVQIELPLLQSVLEEFKLVPIVSGQLDLATARRIGSALRELVDDETLLVASSDFTHYGARFGYLPFTSEIERKIRDLDMGAFEFIENKNPQGFVEYLNETGATICGRDPITILLAMLPEDAGVQMLKYNTSGNITGDLANSVSYLSASFTGHWQNPEEQKDPERGAYLSEEDQARLLELARNTLGIYLESGSKPTLEELDIELTDGISQTMGAFVTLHKNGRLRGCIGEIMPRRELYKAVIDHALNAGLHDPRFPTVHRSELPQLDFEISALSQPRSIASYRDIVIGKHGIVLRKGSKSAVFLPQVAPEQGWGIEETLANLACKAGLAPDSWKQGAEFQVFEAIVFGEK